jgi:outer membrane biosynthesis protein TonB
MLELGQNRSARIASRAPLFLRAFALALLGTLVLAGSAQARGPGGRDAEVTAASLDAAIAQGADATTPVGDVVETPTPTEAPEAGVTAGPGEEKAAEAPAPPPGEEKVAEAPVPPPVEEKAAEAPVPPPVEEKAAEAPAPPPVEEKAPESTPVGPVAEEKVLEAVPAGPTVHEVREGPPPAAPTAPQDAATTEHASGAAEPAPVAPGALLDQLPPHVGGPGGTPTTSGAGLPEIAAAAAMMAARRAGDFICELSALGVRRSGNCAGGWLTAQRVLSGSSPVGFASAAASLAGGTSGPPPGGGHGGTAVGNSPVSPANGSAPSGASGGSAMGASGLALSGFLTLAGLLLLGAPRAMRRLRLSCEPWLTACFVLIPERPG